MNNFAPFTEDFDYVKDFYDVKLSDGTIIKKCWSNGGLMNGIDENTGKWSFKDNIEVRISEDALFRYDKDGREID
jgi:hypothetical protein